MSVFLSGLASAGVSDLMAQPVDDPGFLPVSPAPACGIKCAPYRTGVRGAQGAFVVGVARAIGGPRTAVAPAAGIPCRAGLPCYTAPMTNVDLTQDCASCAALCCAALPFDSGAQFAIDKPAAVPCPHLSTDARCTIHAGLTDAGFGGCVAFTCFGAGQRVTQEMFGGRSWQDDPILVGPMFNAFQDALRVHNLLILLEEAAKLPLPDPAGCAALRAELTPDGPLTTDWLHTVLAGDIQPRVMAYLQTLRSVARP